jgi:hypothetical protein
LLSLRMHSCTTGINGFYDGRYHYRLRIMQNVANLMAWPKTRVTDDFVKNTPKM